jgi:hypothetical protein
MPKPILLADFIQEEMLAECATLTEVTPGWQKPAKLRAMVRFLDATGGFTASELAKAYGAKNLKVVAGYYGKPPQTLINWHRDSPLLFQAVCMTYVAVTEG